MDLKLTKTNDSIEFDIYRKLSYIDTVVPADSNHSRRHKYVAFNSLMNKAVQLPLSRSNLKKEVSIIEQIAVNNGYEAKLVHKILDRPLKQKAYHSIYPNVIQKDERKYMSPILWRNR